MRLRLCLSRVLAAGLLLVMAGGPAALAQSEPFSFRRLFEPPPQDYGRRPAARPETPERRYHPNVPASRSPYEARPAPQPLFPFFSRPREAPPPEYREYREPRSQRPREARRPYDPPPPKKARRVVPAAPSVREEKVDEAEVEPSTFVVVFGDALADSLANGLDAALEEAEDIAIERKVRGDSGLVRNDVHDWPKVVQDYLNTNPKITYAVMMLGSNDRQSIREGDVSHDPLSERWREIYRQRVDAVAKAFADRKIPLLWVGAPPMKNERFSADVLALNEIYRDRVQRAGGVYVDVWPGFVDDENRYAASGPDVNGQTAKLRTADGVFFTRAGARKVAHFVDVELKRLIDSRGGAAVAAPAAPGQPGQSGQAGVQAGKEVDVERLINASLPALPEPQGLPSLPSRPVAGPVLPLTKPDVSPGGALVSGRPKPDGDAAYATEKVLREGVPPPPKPGRADDFRWPRS